MSCKIFIISYIYDTFVKSDMGGHRKVIELAEHLTRLGHDVCLFIPHYEKYAEDIHARIVHVRTVPIPLLRPIIFSWSLLFSLWKQVRKSGKPPDLIYCRPIKSIIPLLFAKNKKSILLCEINGDPYQNFGNGLIQKIKHAHMKCINSINYNGSHGLVAISHGIKRLIMKIHGIPQGKITVIESATNADHFKPGDTKLIREKLHLSPTVFIAGLVGTLYEYQGVGLLIHAAPLIIKEISPVHFLIVGEGMMKQIWEQDVADKNLKDYFTFTGQIPYTHVPHYINAMDVCLAPLSSNRGEASPLKIYDCLACGKPVVISDIDPLKDFIKNAKGIVVFKPDDIRAFANSIIDLAKNRPRLNALGRAARSYIETGHTWQANALSVINVYKNLKSKARLS